MSPIELLWTAKNRGKKMNGNAVCHSGFAKIEVEFWKRNTNFLTQIRWQWFLVLFAVLHVFRPFLREAFTFFYQFPFLFLIFNIVNHYNLVIDVFAVVGPIGIFLVVAVWSCLILILAEIKLESDSYQINPCLSWFSPLLTSCSTSSDFDNFFVSVACSNFYLYFSCCAVLCLLLVPARLSQLAACPH